MILRACDLQFVFPRPALVMGILNVTPDSFSDGGRFMDSRLAADRAHEMVAEGADIIDVGGESTRPGALPVSEQEELRRVLPVLKRLRGNLRVPVSIDTMKPAVARAALDEGASIVNDVGANREGDEMWRLVAQTGAGYVCMHMRGSPANMQMNLRYADVCGEVELFFKERMSRLSDCGVHDEQVIIDPGIGFGKALEHNLALLAGLQRFVALGRPLLLGASRKSFIAKLLGAEPEDRLPASLACACMAVAAGAVILRVHDVAETVQAVRTTEAILARK